MYALAFMVFVIWLIMPGFYFPSIVDPNSIAVQDNFFESLIVGRVQMISSIDDAELRHVDFHILVPQIFCVSLQVLLLSNTPRIEGLGSRVSFTNHAGFGFYSHR